MGFGTFTAHASSARVRISTAREGLAYAKSLPAATQARPHWQAAIASAQNADETEVLIDNGRDALNARLAQTAFYKLVRVGGPAMIFTAVQ